MLDGVYCGRNVGAKVFGWVPNEMETTRHVGGREWTGQEQARADWEQERCRGKRCSFWRREKEWEVVLDDWSTLQRGNLGSRECNGLSRQWRSRRANLTRHSSIADVSQSRRKQRKAHFDAPSSM